MDEQRIDQIEDLRQLEHFLPLGFAFLLPFIEFSTILLLALLAVVYALFVSPLLMPTARADEQRRGFSTGKLTYAISVLSLLLIFHNALHIAAATWGILAAGDSVSNVVGRRYGRRRLPYNQGKTLAGLVSFAIAGTLAASILLLWNFNGSPVSILTLVLFSSLTAFACAFFESLPSPLDDNIIICWVGGTMLALLFGLEGSFHTTESWIEGLVINVAVAAISLRLSWLSARGTLLALVMGFIVYTSLGFPAYLTLVLFLALCSLATQAGAEEKEAQRISQSLEGRRGSINVISNGLVPFGLAIFGFWSSQEFLLVAFLSAVATATVDTVSTEIGQWLGRHPIDVRTFKRCPPGTPGAMSIEGTLAGLGSGLLVASGGVLSSGLPAGVVLAALISAFISTTAESIVGSYSRRVRPFSDEVLNLYNTFFGAFLGGMIWLLL